ncbi:hypothetical protein BRADI_4g19553v3 [Brachypodium distachyon]|uniref:Uncharacterized protein n=1 Tax=Brachypodium distachyon TaxID=15368 RepID=A0A0Q3PGX7_BRADI|nr:hypothetical protein BRADI_4g19553v3 [Brachypodium distachyon]
MWTCGWGTPPLKDQFPSLYRIATNHQAYVAEVMTVMPSNIAFGRNIVGTRLILWEELCANLVSVQLDDQPDSFSWMLSFAGSYFVKSVYDFFC